MEQQRTITKLRSVKVGVMLALMLIAYGVIMSIFLEFRQEKIVNSFKNKATEVVSYKYQNDMSRAVKACNNAFVYMEKSADESIQYGALILVFSLVLIRLSINNRTRVIILILTGLGAGMITMFDLAAGIQLPKAAEIQNVRQYMSWLYYPGYIFFGLGVLMFVYHTFKKIVAVD